MSQPDSNNSSMKWMMVAMVACCTIPIAASLFLGGGLGFWLGRSNQNPIQDQPVNQVPNLPSRQTSP